MGEEELEALEAEFDAICEGKTLDDKAVEDAEKEIEDEGTEETEETDTETEETEEEETEPKGDEAEPKEEEIPDEKPEEKPDVDPAAERIAQLLAEKEEADAEDARLADEIDNIVDYNDIEETDTLVDVENLPDIEFGEGEEKMSIKEVFKEYPAVMGALNAMLGSTVKKVKAEATKPIEADVRRLKFKEDMESIEVGTYDVVTSKEFKTWVGGQSEGMKMLAQSGDRSDSKLVLDAFSKTVTPADEKPAEEKPVVKKKKAPTKKAKMDKLLGSNVGPKGTTKESDGDITEESLAAEWEKITGE